MFLITQHYLPMFFDPGQTCQSVLVLVGPDFEVMAHRVVSCLVLFGDLETTMASEFPA